MVRKLIVGAILFAGFVLMAAFLPAQAAPASSTAPQQGNQPQLAVGVFTADLSGTNETPPVTNTNATGKAVLVLDSDLKTLHWRVSVSGIVSPTAAHIHLGDPGVAGPVVIPLYDGSIPFGDNMPISGTLTLTPTQVFDMVTGHYYVNVHTSAHPTGEIRGQIEPLKSVFMHFTSSLDGLQETPPVTDTSAVGSGFFSLNLANLNMHYVITVSNVLTTITAAHIHLGLPGQPGPVVFPLYTGGGSFSNTSPLSGTVVLTGSNVLDLMTGFYYVNVHTAAHPDGEIRGQIGAGEPGALPGNRRFNVFSAWLLGSNETPPVTSTATGRAFAVLSNDGHSLLYRISVGGTLSPTGVTLDTSSGVSGTVSNTVVATLYSGGGSFGPGSSLKGLLTLNSAQAADLMAGKDSINVTSAAHPSGELRGQLLPFHLLPQRFRTTFNGQGGGGGTGRFDFDPLTGQVSYFITVTNLTNITTVYLRNGAPGQGGTVAFTLYSTPVALGPSGPVVIFDPTHPLSGTLMLSEENLPDLLGGNFYLDVRTASSPNGFASSQLTSEWVLNMPIVNNSFSKP